jgi:hypothetical protein
MNLCVVIWFSVCWNKAFFFSDLPIHYDSKYALLLIGNPTAKPGVGKVNSSMSWTLDLNPASPAVEAI